MEFVLRYDSAGLRLRAIGPVELTYGRFSPLPTALGELPLRYDRFRTRLRRIGDRSIEYAPGSARPVSLGEWPLRYDGERLEAIGPFPASFDGAVMTALGPAALRYDGSRHPVRLVLTGADGVPDGLVAAVFLVLHRRDYRTDLWD